MRAYDVIRKKREGEALSEEEIRWVIDGYVKGEIPDYQVAALCMAIYFQGMTVEETAALTFAIRDSGEKLDFSGIDGVRADKHSTGGVGDKTSLVVAPIVASLGVKVAKMSGRGLGHTGGTVDKLEAIPGFQTDISIEKFKEIVNGVGVAIVGQSARLAPADKLLYALRDVTATVDSIPLIVSSIMGKKLAADDDCIVLDVKTGSGSFMKTVEASRELARQMVEIGKRAGKRIRALITDMDSPLGNAVGNSLEVVEAIHTLQGKGPKDVEALCIALSAHILCLAGKGELAACEEMAKQAIYSGKALQTFAAMVEAQGGDRRWIENPALFPKAKYTMKVCAERAGYIAKVDAEGYGRASLLLGAGRNVKEDVIDSTAGLILCKKRGDYVRKGEPLAILHAGQESGFAAAREVLLAATCIEEAPLKEIPLIWEVVE